MSENNTTSKDQDYTKENKKCEFARCVSPYYQN